MPSSRLDQSDDASSPTETAHRFFKRGFQSCHIGCGQIVRVEFCQTHRHLVQGYLGEFEHLPVDQSRNRRTALTFRHHEHLTPESADRQPADALLTELNPGGHSPGRSVMARVAVQFRLGGDCQPRFGEGRPVHAHTVIAHDEHIVPTEEIRLSVFGVSIVGVLEQLAESCRQAGYLLPSEHVHSPRPGTENGHTAVL